jgi:hypothetical protein
MNHPADTQNALQARWEWANLLQQEFLYASHQFVDGIHSMGFMRQLSHTGPMMNLRADTQNALKRVGA